MLSAASRVASRCARYVADRRLVIEESARQLVPELLCREAAPFPCDVHEHGSGRPEGPVTVFQRRGGNHLHGPFFPPIGAAAAPRILPGAERRPHARRVKMQRADQVEQVGVAISENGFVAP